jgi:hypothetical protein
VAEAHGIRSPPREELRLGKRSILGNDHGRCGTLNYKCDDSEISKHRKLQKVSRSQTRT